MEKEKASRCELQVMRVIWSSKEDMSLQPIIRAVNHNTGNDWKPQTVSTFLVRLVQKGWITGYRNGRHVYYRPLVSKTEWIIEETMENCKIADVSEADLIEILRKQ